MSTSHPLNGISNRRASFADWRSERPFWGGFLLALAGVAIAAIPTQIAVAFAMVPGTFAFVGIIEGVIVLLCGVFAVAKPELASFFGVAGILLAITSLLGALGGFGIGTLLGSIGGAMCVAWIDPEEQISREESD